ncbi:DUF881 domain-containing protein [Solicola sp. PLA-1-18]|uniref:DUF881 domain-containing protein n=1 Tax=Solicola sp. PLA-1-18 TaxID=3380532 RepID=UPI003B7A6714
MPDAPSRTARDRLRGALLGTPSRSQLTVGVLLAVLGFGAVVQVRSASQDDDFSGARRGDLVQLLDSLDAANQRVDEQLRELTATRNRLRSAGESNQAAEAESQAEAGTLGILAGTVPVEGPGVVITIQDEDEAVSASTLLNAVEELRDAGAEAIQVNGVSRVVAQTYFVDVDGQVRVDGRELTRPFVIEAIGSASTLREAVVFRGGLADQVESLGGSVEVDERDRVEITALAERRDPQYSRTP